MQKRWQIVFSLCLAAALCLSGVLIAFASERITAEAESRSNDNSSLPVIESVSIDKTKVFGYTEITDPTEDDSETAEFVTVRIKVSKNSLPPESSFFYLSGTISMYWENYEEGIFVNRFKISPTGMTPEAYLFGPYEYSRVFTIETIVFVTESGPYSNGVDIPLPNAVSYTVFNPDLIADLDHTGIDSISVDKTEVEAPGSITVTVKTSPAQAGPIELNFILSGLNPANFDLNPSVNHFSLKDFDFDPNKNAYVKTFDIPETCLSGNFRLYNAYCWLGGTDFTYDDGGNIHPLPNNLSFTVINPNSDIDTEVPVTTGSPSLVPDSGDTLPSIDDADVLDDIDKAEKGDKLDYSYGKDSELKEEVFDSIRGQDITISISNGPITWIFNGTSITGTATNVKLDVSAALLATSNSVSRDDIKKLVEGTRGATAIVDFANNGVLPGKATIRIDKGSLFPNSNQSTFYVYYYNNTKKQLEYNGEAKVINGDISFDITHNSVYVVRENKLESTAITGGSSSSYRGPIDEHIVGGTTSSSTKDNPHTGA